MKLPENVRQAGPHRGQGRAGFSTVEMLVVMAILIVLAAIGTAAYTSYISRVNADLNAHQQQNLVDQIDVAVDLIRSGANSGLVKAGSNERITNSSTCTEFLESLKAKVSHLRNPFDGSPAVTFSTDYDVNHKRGKIRITCYKLHRHTPANGGSCSMREAGIRVTHFLYNCGGKCHSPTCRFPGSECGNGPVIDHWTYGAQTDKFYGSVEAKFQKADNGSIRLNALGDPLVDIRYGKSVCPGFDVDRIPKEPDY